MTYLQESLDLQTKAKTLFFIDIKKSQIKNTLNNNLCQTQSNNKSVFNLTKSDNFRNNLMEEYKQPIRLNTNFASYQNKMKSLDRGNIKILKCEKFGGNHSNIVPRINTISSLRYQKIQNSNKRNYSYKEVRNLSNYSKNFENCNNDTEQNSTLRGFNYSNTNNTNNTNKHREKSIQNLKLKKGVTNHAFYESKSFSNKKVNEKIKNKNINSYNNCYEFNNTIGQNISRNSFNNCHEFNNTVGPNTARYRIDNKLEKINYNQQKIITPSRFYFYQCAIDNYKDMKK